MPPLTHFDETGANRMVNVGEKPVSSRMARAEATLRMRPETLQLIRDKTLAKGDVLEVARLAGIMAAKKTPELIPLCHSLGLDGVQLDFEPTGSGTLRIESRVSVEGKTGVEMEALTAVCVAGLTVYDMCKSVDRNIELSQVRLLEKSGGKSGHFVRETG